MPLFVKESFVYSICIFILNGIKNAYSQSRLKIIIESVLSCIKQSAASKLVDGYLKKRPYFLNSLSYRAVKGAAELIDRFLGSVYKSLAPVFSSSAVVKEGEAFFKAPVFEKIGLAAVFIAAVEFGFCVGSFVKGSLSDVDMIYIAGPVIISMLMLISKRIYFIFRRSFLCKIIKFLFE